jgi:hypothetical protein
MTQKHFAIELPKNLRHNFSLNVELFKEENIHIRYILKIVRRSQNLKRYPTFFQLPTYYVVKSTLAKTEIIYPNI